MFYDTIRKNVNLWLTSDECKIKDLISYIEKQNKLRDTQLEAIKTYLFLKIKCDNKPLADIFSKQLLIDNSLDNTSLKLKENTCNYLKDNPQEYNKIFDRSNYTDYLFSLPMGAGKTYLMAMFIYLDLYFALNERDNKAFAHNFIVLAPSGLKTSIIPSLKTIQNFNPSWIIPEPYSSNLKQLIKYEILLENSSDKKSNKTNDPNAAKIALHQPLEDLMGLVIITNAEKVILNKYKEDKNGNVDTRLFSEDRTEEEKNDDIYRSNELRNLIGKIPSLAIYIDEVHHAQDDEIKLRKVVNSWSEKNTINSVVGFSGTPYLAKDTNIKLSEGINIKTKSIANTVYYYPLVQGINNFLKKPTVKTITNGTSEEIIEKGVRDFLDNYKDTVYYNNTVAKLAIYCGQIEKLEKKVYPQVSQIVEDYGLNPNEVILKYHDGKSDKYKLPNENTREYLNLDNNVIPSKKKIILLVQIGKEGWDCRSLTGVILSQKGSCHKNMVLQTSCRCLRQIKKGEKETAVIWLNEDNKQELEKQLKKNQDITISEFQTGLQNDYISYTDRRKKLKLTPFSYININIEYTSVIENKITDLQTKQKLERIFAELDDKYKQNSDIVVSDFNRKVQRSTKIEDYGEEETNFSLWLLMIIKESMGGVDLLMLKKNEDILKKIFDKIITTNNNSIFLNELYLQNKIRSDIRLSYYDKYTLNKEEEEVNHQASILNITNIEEKKLYNYRKELMYPETKDEIEEIKGLDEGTKKPVEELSKEELLQLIKNQGVNSNIGGTLAVQYRNKTLHYIPYYFSQSKFEKNFLEIVLGLDKFQDKKLEIYYNGEKSLTDFRIKTYSNDTNYIGIYTPDFLIINRDNENKIHKILIVETKGQGFANDINFTTRKDYISNKFIQLNNNNAKYNKFDYLYIEDSNTEEDIKTELRNKIEQFFINE
ncbi:MAG: DEAD/DEAH box helicase family protein [Bacteroidales bacterium]|jgi:hypothetical protein|nr:DEAD/DEAH box helicase family protein [Bacteroidales bacterium]